MFFQAHPARTPLGRPRSCHSELIPDKWNKTDGWERPFSPHRSSVILLTWRYEIWQTATVLLSPLITSLVTTQEPHAEVKKFQARLKLRLRASGDSEAIFKCYIVQEAKRFSPVWANCHLLFWFFSDFRIWILTKHSLSNQGATLSPPRAVSTWKSAPLPRGKPFSLDLWDQQVISLQPHPHPPSLHPVTFLLWLPAAAYDRLDADWWCPEVLHEEHTSPSPAVVTNYYLWVWWPF